jgi:hypothetical protein
LRRYKDTSNADNLSDFKNLLRSNTEGQKTTPL